MVPLFVGYVCVFIYAYFSFSAWQRCAGVISYKVEINSNRQVFRSPRHFTIGVLYDLYGRKPNAKYYQRLEPWHIKVNISGMTTQGSTLSSGTTYPTELLTYSGIASVESYFVNNIKEVHIPFHFTSSESCFIYSFIHQILEKLGVL
jgi:hypothetical protein